MDDADVIAVQVDFEEPGQPKSGRVAHQWCPGVETDLVRQRGRLEGPGGMDVPAAVDMGTNAEEPVEYRLIVTDPLEFQFAGITHGRDDRVMAGHDQAPWPAGRVRRQGPCLLELRLGHPAAGREMRSRGVEAEDGRVAIQGAEPGERQPWHECSEDLLEPPRA